VVVGGTADVDRAVISRAREAAQTFKERVEFEFWADRSLSQLREEVRSLPSQTAVLLSRIYRDGAGEAMLPPQVAQAIVESANAPLYVLADTILGTGAVGGSVVDVGALGKRVGEIGARILDGSQKSFPFEVRTVGVPIFDWRALKRWGISESRLPPGSTVKFRPPSMWEQYRRYIIGALAIIALQAGLIVGLLLQRARRRRAEKQLRESQEFMELSTSAGKLGLWVRDLKEGGELWVNDRLRSLFGFGRNEVLRFDDVLARIHPDDRARVMTEMERTQKTGISFEEEFRVMVPDGSERWVAARGRTVGEFGQSGARRMGVVFDVTGRKRTEQDLNAALVEIRGLKERLEEENIYLKEEIVEVKGFDEIVGKSDALKYVLTRVEQVAQTDTTVLLLGETGVGKELIAQAIHEKSARANRPLIKVNCATLPEALVESELFGHERGSFTGADRQRKGRFELADGGTILLDEVGELAAGTQAKLLRVLQEGEFERVGGSITIEVNVRVIAATNRKLHEEVPAGRFRQDLFYRLNVYPITVPPLRDRPEDIPLLVSYFARQIGERLAKSITEVPAQVMRELTRYDWPGNIRELQNVIERAVIVSSDGVLRLPEPLMQTTSVPVGEGEAFKEPMKISTLDEAERVHILRVLEATGWRINGPKGAAAILKMHPSTLRFRMKKLGLTKVLSYTTPAQKTNLH
jgi:PAS domain S-box-containing protein